MDLPSPIHSANRGDHYRPEAMTPRLDMLPDFGVTTSAFQPSTIATRGSGVPRHILNGIEAQMSPLPAVAGGGRLQLPRAGPVGHGKHVIKTTNQF